MNRECDNYDHELENNIEICPTCNQPVENIETSLDKRRPIGIAVSLISIFAILFSMLPSWFAFIGGIVIIIGCIITAFIIRMKAAIICSILSAAAMVGILFYYGAV